AGGLVVAREVTDRRHVPTPDGEEIAKGGSTKRTGGFGALEEPLEEAVDGSEAVAVAVAQSKLSELEEQHRSQFGRLAQADRPEATAATPETVGRSHGGTYRGPGDTGPSSGGAPGLG